MDKKDKKRFYDIYNRNYDRKGKGVIFPSPMNYNIDEEIMFSEFDPLGSYTGISENEFSIPIQDADDL